MKWSQRLGAWVAVAVLVVSVAALGVSGYSAAAAPRVTESASSTQPGTDARLLVDRAEATPAPAPAAARGVGASIAPARGPGSSWSTAAPTWRSAGQTKGAWVALSWSEPANVSRVRIDGADGSSGAFLDALVTFSDGSSTLVTTDSRGNVSASFAARVVTSAKLQFVSVPSGVTSIALHAFTIDDSGSGGGAPGAPTTSASAGSPASAVRDGDVSAGSVGSLWRPTAGSSTSWVGHTWTTGIALASVQITGAASGSGSFPGTLVFSDGSRVVVSGVTSGAHPVTMIAFAPRTVTWVRFETNSASAVIGEFIAYGPGTTPPVWPTAAGVSVSPAAYGTCTTANRALGSPQESSLALVCPESGATVRSSASIVVSGPVGQRVTASAWLPAKALPLTHVASTLIKADGRAVINFGLSQIPHGPFAVKITVPASSVPLYVQLYNAGGRREPSPGFAPPGMTLQFEDEFRTPLSVTRLGAGALYAATKPAGRGGSEFGSAVFADPALGLGTLGSFDDYLRLRVQPQVGPDPLGWGREYAGGILSSARVGGSGVSVQYGYFEARILAPAGPGTWPAFWMLDTESVTKPSEGSGEVDAVELYGHNPVGSCHTLHNWPLNGAVSGPSCSGINGAADWALAWHTYGVRVRPNGADYFIDGRQITAKEGLVRDALPYYFLLDLSVGGGWPVRLDPTGGKVEMYVDWVRAYS